MNKKHERRIAELADEYYGGERIKATRAWALGILLTGLDPSDDDLFKHTCLDVSGDLGIDGWWHDEDNSRIILTQIKTPENSRKSISRDWLSQFRGDATSLHDIDFVHAHGNQFVQEAQSELFDALLDDEVRLELYFITTAGSFAKSARSYSEGPGSEPWSFTVEDVGHVKEVIFKSLDLADLEDLEQELLQTHSTSIIPTVDINVPPHYAYEIGGQYKSLRATIFATDLIRVYEQYRGSIFRLNPRGSLGSNKINKAIVGTIESSFWHDVFHFLNNGITVVCDSFRFDPDKSILHIQDFQVVNGCQTTYTLWASKFKVDEKVLVNLTLVESPNFALEIARSTNQQSSMRAEDFASLDKRHEIWARKFKALNPPWRYETKRGQQRLKSAADQKLDKARFSDRVLTLKDVAQWGLAFSGEPSTAKYDLQSGFSGTSSKASKSYEQIMSASDAESLLLPVLVGRRVNASLKTLRAEYDEDQLEYSLFGYCNMHIVALMGSWLRSHYGQFEEGLLQGKDARAALQDLDEWFENALRDAVDAVKYVARIQQAAEKLTNIRQFFRSPARLEEMEHRLREVLKERS